MQKFLKAFLCYRLVHVRVGQAFSDIRPVYGGAPQGSVLSPCYFNCYSCLSILFDFHVS